MNRVCTMSCMIFAIMVANAGEFHIKDKASDWTVPGSYEENAAPTGSGDIVYIGAGVTAYLSSDASFQLVNALDRIIPEGADSVLEITVEDENDEKTLETAFTASTSDGAVANGVLVKNGAGTLNIAKLTLAKTVTRSGDVSFYTKEVQINGGILKLPQELPDAACTYYYGTFRIADAATLWTPATKTTSPSVAYAATQCAGLFGGGIVTNAAMGRKFTVRGSVDSTFTGKLVGGIRLAVNGENGGGLFLMGADSTLFDKNGVSISKGATLGQAAFGMKGAKSSSTTNGVYKVDDGMGTFKYLGLTEEKTDMDITAVKPGEVGIDAGDGRFEFAGTFSGYDQQTGNTGGAAGMNILRLDGTNSNLAVFSGVVKEWLALDKTTKYTAYLKKDGSGVWRKKDNAADKFFGGVGVVNGTLQFDSIAETNEACALGTATYLSQPYSGDKDPDKEVDYAIALGGGGPGTRGIIEFSGEDTNTCCSLSRTRSIAVLSDGGIVNSRADAKLKLKGVTTIGTGARSLTLGGTSANENFIGDVTDTAAAPLSVEKNGTGTWYLSGNQTFHGSLAVKAGKLVVWNPASYRFYKWIVKANQGKYKNGETVTVKGAYVEVQEFGLFDAEGHRQNVFAGWTSNVWNLAEASAAYDTKAGYNDNVAKNRHLGCLFDNNSKHALGAATDSGGWNGQICVNGKGVKPEIGSPETWIPVMMRLPNDAPAITGYDLVPRYSSNYNNANASSVPVAWEVQGSLDGLTWDLLDAQSYDPDAQLEDTFFKGGYWTYDTAQFPTDGDPAGTVHANCRKLDRSAPVQMPSMLQNVTNVTVASGATLEVFGLPVTIRGLKLDADEGLGTIRNVTLAQEGLLELTASHKVSYPLEFKADLSGLSDRENIANWPVTINGKLKNGYRAVAAEDGIKILPAGLVLIVR